MHPSRTLAPMALGLLALTGPVAQAAPDGVDTGWLDRRGDRIDLRWDRRGADADARLDRRSGRAADQGHPRLAQRLDLRGDRLEQRWDSAGDRLDRRLDRRSARLPGPR